MSDFREQVTQRLNTIYPETNVDSIIDVLCQSVAETKQTLENNMGGGRWTEKDTILITYGDSLLKEGEVPLQTLLAFLDTQLGDTLSIVHILPFFPFSSDDGFSVIDYDQVNPDLGTWDDVEAIGTRFKLMADLVINHISAHSAWFQNYLKGMNPGSDYFIEVDPQTDLSQVVRPRSLPLLTEVDTPKGAKHVWTTFSADQIDLNFANPELLLAMMQVFLGYIQHGSRIIRLDAIAFLWKEMGTSCLHLPQTHEVVKLMRDIMDELGDDLILLTETNVPNKENLSYFGNNDEAHMVYQFSLPPLLLHALFTGNSRYLTDWARSLPTLNQDCTFFNFTASHDGIGVRPLEGLIPQDELTKLTEGMKTFGAHISTKRNSDGTDSPYEMNITYYDACQGNEAGLDDLQAARFLCSQTIMMTLAGIPAFYIHSLLATRNDHEGVERTGMPRSINRKKWNVTEIQTLLDCDTHHQTIFNELKQRIAIRTQQPSFHPNASQKILDWGESFFVVQRGDDQELLAISNITNQKVDLPDSYQEFTVYNYDLISADKDVTTVQPYQTLWLVKQ